MNSIVEAAKLQEEYRRLLTGKKLTKKAICDLCIPFRDKYGLTDNDTLRIARKEVELMELVQMLNLMEG